MWATSIFYEVCPYSINLFIAGFSTNNVIFSGVIPPESQENILIWDLLNILQGVEGAYIIPDDIQEPCGIRTFGITPSIGRYN